VQLVRPVPTARGFVIAWGRRTTPGCLCRRCSSCRSQRPRRRASKTLTLLDVRSPHEWKKGHAPGARHIFLGDLPAKLGQLSKADRIAVYCDSGYRASIAAILLQASGFDVANIPGSWQAWKACDLPVEKD
jgi:rhodanese-related sulfurtransferase